MHFIASSIAIALAVYIEHVNASLNDICKLFFIMDIPTPFRANYFLFFNYLWNFSIVLIFFVILVFYI